MTRSSSALIALLVLGGIGALGYTIATRARPDSVAVSNEPAPAQARQSAAPTVDAMPAMVPATSVSASISPETLASWVAETTGEDPAKRAAAIAALANAPKADAIPALQVVMTSGESHVDRPLALRSLRSLAAREGDADGAIRGVIRQAIYHGDNEDVVRAAQAALDEVEVLVSGR